MNKTRFTSLAAAAFLTACVADDRDPLADAQEMEIAVGQLADELQAIDPDDPDAVERISEALEELDTADALTAAPDTAAGSVACDAADSMLNVAESYYSIAVIYAAWNVEATGKAVHWQAYIDALWGENAAELAAEFESGFLPWVIPDALAAKDHTDLAIGHADDVLDSLSSARLAYGPFTDETRSATEGAISYSNAAHSWLDACLGG